MWLLAWSTSFHERSSSSLTAGVITTSPQKTLINAYECNNKYKYDRERVIPTAAFTGVKKQFASGNTCRSQIATYPAAVPSCYWLLRCCWDPAHPGRACRDGRCHLHTPRFHHHCPVPEPRTPPQTQSVLAEGDTVSTFRGSGQWRGFSCASMDELPAGTKWWPPLCVWHLASSLRWRQGWRHRRADLHISLRADSHESLKSGWGHHALYHPGEQKQERWFLKMDVKTFKPWRADHRISEPVWWHHHKSHWHSTLNQHVMKSNRIIVSFSVTTVPKMIVCLWGPG